MRALIQRVKKASVTVAGQVTGSIEGGMLVFLGITHSDTSAEIEWMSRKILQLRIFRDEEGKLNRSLVDIGGELLVVSQFTLYGDTRKGTRPSYTKAAASDIAEPLYDEFMQYMRKHSRLTVAGGVFGAMMDVELLNDGPVTLWLEKEHN